MQELFYPQYQTEIKVHGEWVNTTKPLFPGYLICDTAEPRTVQQYLLRMDDLARVLSQDGQFVPLAKEEVQLIGSFTHRGDRVVPMSEAVPLTPTEYAICEYLARHPGQVMSRAQIREAVLGWESDADDAAISMQVSRARRKLSEAGADPIATVWGMGYKWQL